MIDRMTVEQNKRLVERHLDLAWNVGDFTALDEVWAPDAVVHVVAGITLEGLPALQEHLAAQVSAYSKRNLTIADLVGEGNTVAARWSFQGLHTGEALGVAPTNRPVTITGMDFYRADDGKLVEEWIEANILGLMYQLGALS